MDALKSLLFKINELILNPLIALMFAIAVLYFLWGMLEFIQGAADPKARETGRSHMIWGIIGLFIMISVYGILNIIINTLGVDNPEFMKDAIGF